MNLSTLYLANTLTASQLPLHHKKLDECIDRKEMNVPTHTSVPVVLPGESICVHGAEKLAASLKMKALHVVTDMHSNIAMCPNIQTPSHRRQVRFANKTSVVEIPNRHEILQGTPSANMWYDKREIKNIVIGCIEEAAAASKCQDAATRGIERLLSKSINRDIQQKRVAVISTVLLEQEIQRKNDVIDPLRICQASSAVSVSARLTALLMGAADAESARIVYKSTVEESKLNCVFKCIANKKSQSTSDGAEMILCAHIPVLGERIGMNHPWEDRGISFKQPFNKRKHTNVRDEAAPTDKAWPNKRARK